MTDEGNDVCIKDRLARFMHRLENVEGRYTDADIIDLALRRINELEAAVRRPFDKKAYQKEYMRAYRSRKGKKG